MRHLLRRVAGGEVDINANMVIASFLDISYALFLAISERALFPTEDFTQNPAGIKKGQE